MLLSMLFLCLPTQHATLTSQTRLCVPNLNMASLSLEITITGRPKIIHHQCATHPPLYSNQGDMAPLQFQPLASQPTPTFWSALNTLKLDKLKLDDTQQPILGWLEEGREVIDKDNGDRRVALDGSLGVGGSSFGKGSERSVSP